MNSKKSEAQLTSATNDIMIARQKRETIARAAQAQSQDYENHEITEAHRKLAEIEHAALSDRKAAAAVFFGVMRDYPELVAERIGWLLDGDYGYGALLLAKRVLDSPRMNRSAVLTHMIGAFEWSAPGVMARTAWGKLTHTQHGALETAVQGAIARAEWK